MRIADVKTVGDLAEPLGYDKTSRVLFQGAVGGIPLSELIGCKEFLENVGATARSLAGIHQTPVRLDRVNMPHEELLRLESRASSLNTVAPENVKKAKRIFDWLKRSMPRTQSHGLCLIHGDFSMRQVLAGDNKISIIDFDDACMGDPLADIARFLGFLEHPILEGTIGKPLKRQIRDEFCREYEKAMPGVLVRKNLMWHKTMTFLKRAIMTPKHLIPGWSGRMDHYMSEAETLINYP